MHTTNNKTRKNNRKKKSLKEVTKHLLLKKKKNISSVMAHFESQEPILSLPLKHHLHHFNNSFL
jgi:hypothetical protein